MSGHNAAVARQSDTYGAGHSGPGTDNPRSSNHGPHSSNLLNKLDPRVDSDKDNRGITGTASATGHGTGYGATGATQYDNPHTSNTGPHSSNLANKADPRIDSDRDHRGTATTATTTANGGYGHGTTHIHNGHQSGTTTTGYDNPRSANAGPHDSSIANKVDPRVDSDRDNRGHNLAAGASSTTGTGTHLGTGHTAPHATTGVHGGTTAGRTYDSPHSTNAGPHNSNISNKLDPRVDSDRDNRAATGHTGVAGGGAGTAPLRTDGYASAGDPTHTTTETGTSSNPIKKGLEKLVGK